ncbi:hypothetical protein SLEP1_g44431 [Rubroshorea leprosula]|uniref:Uncharacterized protein n=1 Tax=Rubroshorea leprosula TaxID=152421 RepID=A0AAV5LI22_9ROSI|nr:hypothetical protein SLEP1_g44431 [Rubroshorea leprosula]
MKLKKKMLDFIHNVILKYKFSTSHTKKLRQPWQKSWEKSDQEPHPRDQAPTVSFTTLPKKLPLIRKFT